MLPVVMIKIRLMSGEVISEDYVLEYGKDCLQMHVGAVQPEERALVVDDLIATGGTLCAAMTLLGIYFSLMRYITGGERSVNLGKRSNSVSDWNFLYRNDSIMSFGWFNLLFCAIVSVWCGMFFSLFNLLWW